MLMTAFIIPLPSLFVGSSVRGDDPLGDTPSHIDLEVILSRDERIRAGPLLLGEEAGAGMQGPLSPIKQTTGTAPMLGSRLLDALPAPIRPVVCKADDMEGVHDHDLVREFLSGRGFETCEHIHSDALDAVPVCCRRTSWTAGLGPPVNNYAERS